MKDLADNFVAKILEWNSTSKPAFGYPSVYGGIDGVHLETIVNIKDINQNCYESAQPPRINLLVTKSY